MKNQRTFLTISVLIFCALTGIAQSGWNPPNFYQGPPGDDIFAAPDVQALHKYNLIPENLYVGKVNVNIPIYTVQHGGISIPISLSYNSGGIKVSEIASNAGLGWNLNAGGSILKIVRDLPDDDFYGVAYNEPDDTGDNAGSRVWQISQRGSHRILPPYTINYQGQSSSNADEIRKEDSSPDFFYVNAPGISTKFYLEDANSTDLTTSFENRIYNAVFLDHSGVKINGSIQRTTSNMLRLLDATYQGTPDQTINGIPFYNWSYTDFDSFEVVNNNGFKYTFDIRDISEVQTNSSQKTVNKGFNSTNWNLSKISNQRTNSEIFFTYEEYVKEIEEELTSYTTTYQDPNSSRNMDDHYYVGYDNVSLVNGTYDTNYGVNTKTMSPKVNRLTEITWDGGSVEFVYNLTRIDDPNEKALTGILVKDSNDNVIKEYVLNYSYFNSKENCSDKQCKRLKLDSIEELSDPSGTIKLKHEFDYYYDNPLPRRDSFQRDFLGYYNNNGYEWTSPGSGTRPPNPILHFYKDQGVNSILPFQRTNGSNYRIINGNYSLVPNSYSLSGLLKKVTYPTGGNSEFIYENHKFNLQGAEYTAGGARILKQKLDDGSGNIREIDYQYTLSGGGSSGYINKIPTYANLNKAAETGTYGFSLTASESIWKEYFTCYDKPRYALELTDGSFVGYARVIKKETGNGYVETTYSSPNLYPNQEETTVLTGCGTCLTFFNDNNNYPSLNVIDYDVRRGRVLEEKIFSENGTELRKSVYDYDYEIFDTVNLDYQTTILGSPFTQGGIAADPDHTSFFNIERNINTQITTTEYFDGGNKVTDEYFVYDNDYPLVKEHRKVVNSDEMKTNVYYTYDSEVSGQPYLSNLVTQNRLTEPIKQEVRNNNTLVSIQQTNYDNFGSGIILPKSNSTAKGNETLVEGPIIDIRDNKGNAEQFYDKAGKYTTIIWGYNGQYPIAKIENFGDSQITTAIQNDIDDAISASNADTDRTFGSINKEGALRDALDELRNNSLPSGALMTSFTYDPLIGVTSITDPRGRTSYYIYDEYNRLEYIKDHDGNILSKNQYHYKGQ